MRIVLVVLAVLILVGILAMPVMALDVSGQKPTFTGPPCLGWGETCTPMITVTPSGYYYPYWYDVLQQRIVEWLSEL